MNLSSDSLYRPSVCARRAQQILRKEDLRDKLPQVGQHRKEMRSTDDRRLPCTVIDVNTEHLWYVVRFEDGTKESYKLGGVEE